MYDFEINYQFAFVTTAGHLFVNYRSFSYRIFIVPLPILCLKLCLKLNLLFLARINH